MTKISVLELHLKHGCNGISKLDNNTGATNPTAYMVDADVYQLGRGATNHLKLVMNK